jgi:hypothetical protein
LDLLLSRRDFCCLLLTADCKNLRSVYHGCGRLQKNEEDGDWLFCWEWLEYGRVIQLMKGYSTGNDQNVNDKFNWGRRKGNYAGNYQLMNKESNKEQLFCQESPVYEWKMHWRNSFLWVQKYLWIQILILKKFEKKLSSKVLF